MKSWFSNHSKLKRWMLLICIGIILICFSVSKILILTEINLKDIAYIVISFTIGFTSVILGLINFNKRSLELMLEATDHRNTNKQKINLKKLIYNKNIYDQGPKVVVIGGGCGINSVLSGLKKYTNNITAIIDTSDYGKRKYASDARKINTLPLTDIRDSLIALAPESQEMAKILKYRFEEKIISNLDFSEILFASMHNVYGNYLEAISKCGDILNITGKVLPVTLEPMNIIAELENGYLIDQKDKIEKIVYEKFTKISRVVLSPRGLKPSPGVIDAIKNADAIIIGPGALYTNVIPNLLVPGVSKAIKDSKALKIYISNIMTVAGQTDNFTLEDHIQAINDHCGRIFNYCILDNNVLDPSVVRKYNKAGQDVIESKIKKFKEIVYIKKPLSNISNGLIRHNPDLTAQAIIEVICEDLKYKDKANDPQYLMLSNILDTQKSLNKKKTKKKNKNKNKNKKAKVNVLNKKSKYGLKYSNRLLSMQDADKKKFEDIEENVLKKKFGDR